MNSPKYQVYIAYAEKKYRIFLSFNPAVDLEYLKEKGYLKVRILTSPLPLGQAFYVWQSISDPEERRGKEFKGSTSFLGKLLGIGPGSIVSLINSKKRKATSLLQASDSIDSAEQAVPTLNRVEMNTIKEILRGRILLPGEIEKLFLERNRSLPKDIWSILQILWLEGSVDIYPAIERRSDGSTCNRCGQNTKLVTIDCVRCGTTCMVCEECITLGEARACTPLIGTCEELSAAAPKEKYRAQLDFTLTQAQTDAAQKVTEFYRGQSVPKTSSCLVWAVCGAGKTEVSFGAITEALNKGEKVLFAVPRRDVVIELEPRLKKAFPGVNLASLYGGSEGKFQESQITIATTHQASRFYKKFSLIVLDEADAYPYQGSKMLYYFIERAKHPKGKIIYMTATPGKELLKSEAKGQVMQVTIPARHHRQPLPKPQFLLAPGLDRNKPVKLPDEVLKWLHKMVEGEKGQVFIFVPTIKLTEKVAEYLQESLSSPPFNFPKDWVQFSHSKDPLRDEKREHFKAGQFPLFITTSIMERGITVPRAKVLVLYADYELIFDQGTLIQMAGRSGRLDADPKGEVLFVGKKLTEEISSACKVIEKMNLEASEKGYLDA